MSVAKSVVHRLGLPEDVFFDSMIVETTGRSLVTIYNFSTVREYEQDHILVTGKKERVCISGKCLVIEYYSKLELHIYGCIESAIWK